MRKRLVRKAFDMILGISMSENRDVCHCFFYFLFFVLFAVYRETVSLDNSAPFPLTFAVSL